MQELGHLVEQRLRVGGPRWPAKGLHDGRQARLRMVSRGGSWALQAVQRHVAGYDYAVAVVESERRQAQWAHKRANGRANGNRGAGTPKREG